MLYVFHVDMGRMLKFDMNVALSSVSNLKDTIERLHGISAQNIVLLVSGGEMLTKSTQVSFYSAGTDTNPIYMFLIGDAKLPPAIPAIENDVDLNDQVERCLTLPAVYDTVVTRAQLAQQMYELAREEENICERLVHEQHLQQQGWSAVVANMEDLTEEFRQRFRDFCLSFDRHLEKRAAYIELLNYFSEDLSKLSRIPILPGLMQMAQEDFHGFDELLDNDEVFSRSQQNVSVLMAHDPQSSAGQALDSIESQDDEKRDSTSPNKKPKMGCDDDKGDTMSVTSGGSGTRRTLTLLQWISAKENHNKLTEMSEECIQGLNTFDEAVYEKLKEEVNHIIKSADQSDMKEVKGLSERLCKLEEIKYKIKNMVQDQKELSTAFQQNQNRAINLRDASILPDLCASHRSQLLVMLQNHQKIRELRRCISRAKEELGSNLHTRLKRIIVLENKMSEFDNKQLFYHRCLRRAERHISIIEQIHQAPCIYVAAVTEVIRRKIFSGEFRQWASRLAEDFDSIHSEEINRRRNFNASFEGHFLNILFPGMNDMPPAFANENPLIFDARLPNLTKSDIDILTSYLPDLTHHIQLPDMGPVINFFISRSGNHNSNIKSSSISSTTNKILQTNISGPLNAHHQRVQELQSQSKDGESETDTEEFEKVIQPEMSPTDNTNPHQSTASDNVVYQVAHMATSTEPLQTHTVETLTENEPRPPKKPPRHIKNNHQIALHSPAPIKTITPALPPPKINNARPPHHDHEHLSTLSVISEKDTPTPCDSDTYNPIAPFPLYLGHHSTTTTTDQRITEQLITTTVIIKEHSINTTEEDGGESEFVNSDFYIDESLPSSYGDTDDDNNLNAEELLLTQQQTTDDGSNLLDLDFRFNKIMSFTYPIHDDKKNTNKLPHFETKESMETVFGLLQENLGSTRLEVERLKSILKAMSEVSQECIKLARVNFQQFKSDQENYQIDLRSEFQNISEKWQLVQMQYESREQDIIEMQAKHSVEVTNLETAINMKDKEILDMRNDQQQKDLRHSEQVSQLEAKCTALEEKYHLLEQQMESLNESLQAANAEKVRAVAEAREKLIHEHKSEIESLRCRYKLMTSMERSPSDTSLEKIEKPADMIELACHETIVSQIREDLRVEKEEAIKQAVDCERSIWEAKALPLPRSLNENNDNNVSVLKLMLDDKERYIDMLRDKTAMLTQDNLDLKTQLSILTNEEVNSWLKEKVDFLNREKARIEKELNMEKSRRTEMEQSFAELRGSAMEASTLPRSKSSGSNHRYVVLESCSKGDIVFVVWSMRHYQFMVVQDSASLYFVNADSLSALNLRLPGPGELEMPSPFYALGRVVHKEYCQARKDENRYRVNKGSKFYRIKLEALSRNESKWTGRRERLESSSSNVSINRSLSQNDSGEPSSLTHLSILREAPSHDTVDLGSSIITTASTSAGLKERTISITSVTEEDDEPISLLSDRCRYISVSEEEETNRSVITEQPTSSYFPPMNNAENPTGHRIGLFTLIEPLIAPIQMSMDVAIDLN
ncbi:RB1-inducible coiled-coil protein 1 isoform X2 [Episyrphus balteatus]|uniref:RB1-inducible coiled-coil protein 1 isoform X2 n=1 Tax=Episyrphus balteatus TaxID=286459 RepID=UPI00248642A1|nr:RB1-inducible coiled-coil protein 1 isoform X2 [Episyrphus balteatus]